MHAVRTFYCSIFISSRPTLEVFWQYLALEHISFWRHQVGAGIFLLLTLLLWTLRSNTNIFTIILCNYVPKIQHAQVILWFFVSLNVVILNCRYNFSQETKAIWLTQQWRPVMQIGLHRTFSDLIFEILGCSRLITSWNFHAKCWNIFLLAPQSQKVWSFTVTLIVEYRPTTCHRIPLATSARLGLSKTVLGSETAVLWQDWSQTSLSLGLGLAALVLVLVLVLYFWSCLKHCCARQTLCDMM